MTSAKNTYSIFVSRAFLFCTIALSIFVRLRMLNLPLERDEGEYAYAGQLLHQGVPPYEGIYNMKFPGTYFCYYIIETLFGQTLPAIRLSLLFINVLCIFIFYFIAKKWLRSPEVACFATVCYCLLSLSDSVQGLIANAEQFVMLFALPGTLCMQVALKKNTLWYVFISAIFLGSATIMKQQGAVFALFAFSYLLLEKISSRKSYSSLLRAAAVFGCGFLFPFVLLIFWLYKKGVLEKFYELTFLYAHDYISQLHLQGWWQFNFSPIFASNFVIWVLSFAGMIITWLIPQNKKLSLILWLFGILSFSGVAPGLYFRPHYYNLALPAASLFAGMSFSGITLFFSGRKKIAAAMLYTLVLGFSLYVNREYYFNLNSNAESLKMYAGEPFTITQKIGDYIKQNSAPSDRIAIFGSEPEIYFYAQRKSATSLIYDYPLFENQRYQPEMMMQFFSQVDSLKPFFLLFSDFTSAWSSNSKSDSSVIQFYRQQIKNHYTLCKVAENVDQRNASLRDPDSTASTEPHYNFRILIFKRKRSP